MCKSLQNETKIQQNSQSKVAKNFVEQKMNKYMCITNIYILYIQYIHRTSKFIRSLKVSHLELFNIVYQCVDIFDVDDRKKGMQ